MGEETKKKSSKGCFYYLGVLFLWSVAAGVGTAVYFISIPQGLSDLEYEQRGQSRRDLKRVFQNAIDKGHALAIKEDELNHWINTTLESKQGGLAAEWVKLQGVLVRMEGGYAEVIQKRTVFGRQFTVSMFVRVEESDDNGKKVKSVHLNSGPLLEGVPYPRRGGRYGTLQVPEGFLVFVLPSYKKLATLYENELKLAIEEMESVEFEKGRVVLKPWNLPESDAARSK